MAKGMQHRGLTTFTRVVVLIAIYFLGGLVGKETSFLSGSVALVWPPAGIALAAILLFGYRFWPGVALGAVLFSFMNGSERPWATPSGQLSAPTSSKGSLPSTMQWSAPAM
jgi:integral membrane sensor domain MASE1